LSTCDGTWLRIGASRGGMFHGIFGLVSNVHWNVTLLHPNECKKTDRQIQENTVPHWLLLCICNNQTQRCQCNAKLRPEILCICNHPYNIEPPIQPNPTLTVQFIEFTYCNDRYSLDKINEKIVKYKGLIEDIKARGWKVDPLLGTHYRGLW
jgi:hypothetical protein